MKIKQIHLSRKLQNDLSLLSKSRYPEESCAILFGKIENEIIPISRVTKILELQNITHSQVEFQWDDIEFYNQIVTHQKQGLQLVGIFHSHPHDPNFSDYDRAVIQNTGKLYPELIWVIYGNTTDTFNAVILSQMHHIKKIPIISSE